MITLIQLEVFVKIVEERSFTRAADALHLTQSGISHTVSGLEKELGVSLFYRNKKGIDLTEEGMAILPFARNTLLQIEKIKQTSSEFLGLQKGTIKLGGFPSIMAKHVPSIISSFQNSYPNIKFLLYEGSYEEIQEMVEKGIIDVGLTVFPASKLHFTHLTTDKMVAVFPNGHSLAEKGTVTIEEIASEKLIKDIGCERYLNKLTLYDSFHIDFAVKDLNLILSMVQEGLGVTILPEMAVSYNSFQVTTVEISPVIKREIGICFDEGRKLPLVANVFHDFIQKWFNNKK